ncbi:AAA family ATPase [Erythrobacter sp. GH3-10]|uniref:Gluconokinase n=1 Tax=Aurantiacibacter rhizosphaerae TaxID=2691582 RepID=A0A844XAS4_9SPHN|nr:gluconokinase [Aurantiacibacter rhizosphaerae]MWV26930.1 AAA family ATPase [Aurantiacibacter rhizosphaerae]
MSKARYRGLVVIGPSGNGKSTFGRALAERLRWSFVEGDDHHPRANVAKMARGEPLTDEDRAPFLDSIAHALSSGQAVAACSALKRVYRERMSEASGLPLLFVLPQVGRQELQRRMEKRTGHFMPTAMLQSQLNTFEPPASDEACMVLDGTLPPEQFAEAVTAYLTSGN